MPFDIDGENLEAFHVSEAFETMSCRCSECDWEGVWPDFKLALNLNYFHKHVTCLPLRIESMLSVSFSPSPTGNASFH